MMEFKEQLWKMSRQERLLALETLPGYLAESTQGDRLHQLLTDFDFVEAKLEAFGVQALIEDYDLAIISDVLLSGEQSETLKLIQGAIRKSAHILEKDKTQLAGQLLGRLLDFEMPEIQAMLQQAKQWKDHPWLRPLRGNLERRYWVSVEIAPDGLTAISVFVSGCETTISVSDIENETVFRSFTCTSGTQLGVVAITPDRKTAVLSDNETPEVWDIESETELRTLTGHTRYTRTIAITPNGLTAISGSDDCTLKVWDIDSGKELRTLTGHTDGVSVVTIAPDGKTAISASSDKTLKIWDINSGRCLRTLTGHTTRVNAVAIAPNGLTAISASWHTLKIWDLLSGEEVASFSGDGEFSGGCAFAPDGVTVVAGDNSGRVRFLRLEGMGDLGDV